MVRLALLAAVVAGCTYAPGSFASPGKTFPGQRVTIGCLDLSIDRRADLDAVKDGQDAVVLEYQFANRCDDPVVIDLARVPVIARTVDGDEITLTPYDPQLEMIATTMDARQVGREPLAYVFSEPLAQVCVDAAAVASAREARWFCFSSKQAALDEVATKDEEEAR